jgi:hypothetical protein
MGLFFLTLGAGYTLENSYRWSRESAAAVMAAVLFVLGMIGFRRFYSWVQQRNFAASFVFALVNALFVFAFLVILSNAIEGSGAAGAYMWPIGLFTATALAWSAYTIWRAR